jgi:hypothetical protein
MLQLAQDRSWLEKQDAAQLAILFGVNADKLYRLLPAVHPLGCAGSDDQSHRRMPSPAIAIPTGWIQPSTYVGASKILPTTMPSAPIATTNSSFISQLLLLKVGTALLNLNGSRVSSAPNRLDCRLKGEQQQPVAEHEQSGVYRGDAKRYQDGGYQHDCGSVEPEVLHSIRLHPSLK